MGNNNQFKKNFLWNILGTSLNAFNSFFFLITVTRINGVSEAGIYTIAFSTACILYMIGIYAGRIYQVTESSNVTDKDYIINRIISCVMAIIFCILFVLFRRYDTYKSIIFMVLAIYKVLEAFSDVLYGIMQKNNRLDKAGKSCFFKALFSLVLFIIIDFITKNLLLSCLSIVVVFLVFIIFYDVKNIKNYIDVNSISNIKNVMNIFINGFFPFAISFIGLYIVNAQKYSIDNYLNQDLQAIFGIIIMPATILGLLVQFLIHPYINNIFDLYKKKEFEKIKKILYKIIFIILIFGIICSLLGYLLGTQVLGFVYGIDLSKYKCSLLIILIASTLYTMAGIMSPILITMRSNFIQFIIYLIVAIFELIISNILVLKYGFDGAIISYLVTMIVYFVIFYITTMIIINKKIQN